VRGTKLLGNSFICASNSQCSFCFCQCSGYKIEWDLSLLPELYIFHKPCYFLVCDFSKYKVVGYLCYFGTLFIHFQECVYCFIVEILGF